MNNIDWLGQQALKVLENSVSKEYAEQNKKLFQGKDRFGCLLALNNFDSETLRDLAEQLNIQYEKLAITVDTVRSL